jgi:hypothetical protein
MFHPQLSCIMHIQQTDFLSFTLKSDRKLNDVTRFSVAYNTVEQFWLLKGKNKICLLEWFNAPESNCSS